MLDHMSKDRQRMAVREEEWLQDCSEFLHVIT